MVGGLWSRGLLQAVLQVLMLLLVSVKFGRSIAWSGNWGADTVGAG